LKSEKCKNIHLQTLLAQHLLNSYRGSKMIVNAILLLFVSFASVTGSDLESRSSRRTRISKSTIGTIPGIPSSAVEEVNLQLNTPFKISGFNVGAVYKVPKIGIFVHRAWDIVGGQAQVQCGFCFGDETVMDFNTIWSNDRVEVFVEGDSNVNISSIGAATTLYIAESSVDLKCVYKLLTKETSLDMRTVLNEIGVNINVDGNSSHQDATLTLSVPLDIDNDFIPSINVKTRDFQIGWRRKWEGGSFKATYIPKEKATEIIWTDDGVNCTWVTSVKVSSI
jgi:hypothetical protein